MTPDELVIAIRNKFEEKISVKTGWGKNEIIRQLDTAIMEISLKELKIHIKE